MKPLLVVLAAGMGSRYGGLKQMDPIGQNGETLLDYSVYDALRSGFEKVIFIIRHDMEKDFKELVLSRMKSVAYEVAYQELDALVPTEIFEKAQEAGRTKPWGTTHALLCAADMIKVPAFGVINADDFYGQEAFDVMGSYMLSSTITQAYIVPYHLEKTLSPQGTVARGVCEIKDTCLVSVNELTAIAREEQGIFNTLEDGSKEELPPDTPVSMNFWGFPRSILPSLRKYFFDFLQDPDNLSKNECYLPKAADWIIKNGLLTIRSLKADSEWFGLTYKEDREAAANRIAELVAGGVYPASLWE
ncbi:MAG: NTP transferase domain-containing protein [Treponema sp.]|jgi:hypothetical protein|nr:NTP transferase domain-containing protein [Treponema sp.]